MGHFSLELLVGSMFCLLHLGIGIAVGSRMSRNVTVLGTKPQSDAPIVPQQVIDWNEVRVRLAELSPFIQAVQVLPLAELRDKKDDLLNRISNLHNAMEGKPCEHPSKPQPLPVPQCEPTVEVPMTEQGVHTNEQILALLDGATFERTHPLTPISRHKFAVTQPLATGGSDGVLCKICQVQCHDLSVNDVRYVVDHPPTAERVVIGLGVPKPVKWLAGTVEDFHSVFMYGRVGYLVTVRFIANVESNNLAL
jgi:hypothetical protein